MPACTTLRATGIPGSAGLPQACEAQQRSCPVMPCAPTGTLGRWGYAQGRAHTVERWYIPDGLEGHHPSDGPENAIRQQPVRRPDAARSQQPFSWGLCQGWPSRLAQCQACGCSSTHTAQSPSSCLPLAHGCYALSDGILAVAVAALTRCPYLSPAFPSPIAADQWDESTLFKVIWFPPVAGGPTFSLV